MSDPENQAEPVRQAVRAYAALQPQLASATQAYVALIQVLLDDAGIDYLSVTGRTKSVASFAAKANRTEGDGPLYPDPLEQITDQIGVRVITYVHSDVAAVAEVLDDELAMLDDRDLGEETARSGRFGYASRHLLVQTHPGAELPTLEGHRASVQVRTVLQHAWAEFEHDIRYKGNVPEDAAADLDRRFTLAAGLIELADREFATIRERIQMAAPGSAVEADADPHRRAGAGHLPGRAVQRRRLVAHRPLRLDRRAADPSSASTSLDDLADLLTSVDADAVIRRMGYRYPAGAVRRLDDALLAIFGEQYVDPRRATPTGSRCCAPGWRSCTTPEG